MYLTLYQSFTTRGVFFLVYPEFQTDIAPRKESGVCVPNEAIMGKKFRDTK